MTGDRGWRGVGLLWGIPTICTTIPQQAWLMKGGGVEVSLASDFQ